MGPWQDWQASFATVTCTRWEKNTCDGKRHTRCHGMSCPLSPKALSLAISALLASPLA